MSRATIIAVLLLGCSAPARLQRWDTRFRNGVVTVALCWSCPAPARDQYANFLRLAEARCWNEVPYIDEEGTFDTGDGQVLGWRSADNGVLLGGAQSYKEHGYYWKFHCAPEVR